MINQIFIMTSQFKNKIYNKRYTLELKTIQFTQTFNVLKLKLLIKQ